VALTARDSGPSLLCRRVLRTCFCLQCEPPHHISVSSKITYHQHLQPHLVYSFLVCFVTTTYLRLLRSSTVLLRLCRFVLLLNTIHSHALLYSSIVCRVRRASFQPRTQPPVSTYLSCSILGTHGIELIKELNPFITLSYSQPDPSFLGCVLNHNCIL